MTIRLLLLQNIFPKKGKGRGKREGKKEGKRERGRRKGQENKKLMRKKRERKVNKRRDKYILQLLIFITQLLFVYVAVAGASRRRPDPSDETTKRGKKNQHSK